MKTNRPVIDRWGLKRSPYTWTLVEGRIPHRSIQEDIIKELERHLRGQVKPDDNRGRTPYSKHFLINSASQTSAQKKEATFIIQKVRPALLGLMDGS